RKGGPMNTVQAGNDFAACRRDPEIHMTQRLRQSLCVPQRLTRQTRSICPASCRLAMDIRALSVIPKHAKRVFEAIALQEFGMHHHAAFTRGGQDIRYAGL